MAVPTISFVILAACVLGMEQTICAANGDLVDVVLSLKNDVAELRRNGEEHERKYNQLKKRNDEQEIKIGKQERKYNQLKKRNDEQKAEIAELRTAFQEQQNRFHVRDRRAPERVAFSTYLSQDQQHTGIGQKIKYDGILLNEGNGYNPHLGAFEAPARGLYLFAYTVAKWRAGEVRVSLVKNGNTINGAIADVRTNGAEEQAGNVALVELDVGDVVYVEEVLHPDALVYGSTAFRWTTFSGVLLM